MKNAGSSSNGHSNGHKDEGRVVDFAEVREKRLEDKRRQNERVFFKNLLNVYSVTGDANIHPIELIEASEEGISFLVPANLEKPWPTHSGELPIRIYFSHDTYLEILVMVKNSKPAIDSGKKFTRYGCAVDKNTQSYPAFESFVRFLKQYSLLAHKDMGDVTAFYR